ncbi:MAG: phytanoyl-CoA dioxygenase family protein [Hyphomicrobiaceae bacterium]|nr:phytanoyl-CoA dioxygenase family protein [Hyphomicrobiaceae bacterium]
MSLSDDLDTRFAEAGIAIIEHALDADDLEGLERAFPVIDPGAGGARTAAFAPEHLASLGRHTILQAVAERLGKAPMQLVGALALDKTADANWFVPWHQDRSDELGERPHEALARSVALRVHLDDCGEDNGPLEVLPGTHGLGRIGRAEAARLATSIGPLLCLAARGDIVAMRPLLLHRSQRARIAAHRRVLHLEWAPAPSKLM